MGGPAAARKRWPANPGPCWPASWSVGYRDSMLATGAADLDIAPLLEAFTVNGYARLGTILSAQGARRLRACSEALMLGPAARPGVFYQHDSPSGRYGDLAYGDGWVGPSRAYRKLEHLELDPAFLEWIENPLFERISRAVIGDAVSLYRAVLWNKAPRAGTELPWHQDDGSFWGIDRAPSLQVWTALDDAPEAAGCLEVVPGTHHLGLASPEGGTVQAHRLEDADAPRRAFRLPALAGESILIHNHLWHRSGRNATPAPRRAVSISYLDAATRCLRRRRAPRQFRRVFVASSGAGH